MNTSRDIATTPFSFSPADKRALRAFGLSIGLDLARTREQTCDAKRAAVHEVGHLVVHFATGRRNCGIRLRYGSGDLPDALSDAAHARGEVRDFGKTRQRTPDRVMTYLGGPVCESLHFGSLTDGYWGDVWNVRALAEHYSVTVGGLCKLVVRTRALMLRHRRFVDAVGKLLADVCDENGVVALTGDALMPLFRVGNRRGDEARAAYDVAFSAAWGDES